jgi:methylthioribulose-1-phosphate dehydratase
MSEATKLSALIRTLNSSGHNPATSGNYSLRTDDGDGYVLVSESGIDKSQFREENLLPVNLQTGALHSSLKGSKRKSSDETAIHLCIYRETAANCVLHSHLLEVLLFADLFPNQDFIEIEKMEMLKAFSGVKTHETKVQIPCFENTQDIEELSTRIAPVIRNRTDLFGIILRGHGLYAWGSDVNQAKRHLEAFEYILKYYVWSKRSHR